VKVVDILQEITTLLLAGKLNLVCSMLQFLGQSYCYYMQISSLKRKQAEIFLFADDRNVLVTAKNENSLKYKIENVMDNMLQHNI
jgi:hypothetical protein